jgi:hypothetical protein
MKILVGGEGIKPPKEKQNNQNNNNSTHLAQWSCLKCCCAPQ